jgi:hypothetical protein
MADKFRPVEYLPYGIYDARYWNIVAEDTFNLFTRLFVSGLTGKFLAAPGRIIRFCGNPVCCSPIAFYPEKRPLRRGVCSNIVNWDQNAPEAEQTIIGIKKCPTCGYTTNDVTIKICPYERDKVRLM